MTPKETQRRNAVFMFAHTDQSGKNAAQARIRARTYTQAQKIFTEVFPGRVITASGIQGSY